MCLKVVFCVRLCVDALVPMCVVRVSFGIKHMVFLIICCVQFERVSINDNNNNKNELKTGKNKS